MPTLDIFRNDAFSVSSLTDAINAMPFMPGRAGEVCGWAEEGVTTTTIIIEQINGTLSLVNPSQRGGPGSTLAKDKRTMRSLIVPHYQIDDAIVADEVQNVRAFGSESEVDTVAALVNRRMMKHTQLSMDPTLEYQRIGAIKGVILNGDGTTLYDLFAEFGVSQAAEIDFDLDNATPASGALRKKCTQVVRTIADALGGTPFTRIHAMCSDSFWDDLIAHPEVRATYLNQAEAAQLRGSSAYEVLDYGGIRFENYRGAVGGSPFIAADKAHFFPVGAAGFWRTVYAPADYNETVNTIGLPRYAKQYDMQNGKGVNLEVQMNALNYATRPAALVKGKRT
jgi:hypothetical protein